MSVSKPQHTRANVQPETVSVEQAARIAGIGRSTLYAAISDGSLRTIKLGKRRLVRLSTLRTWLEALENGA